MFRPAPRLVAALLWLAIALLPLRALGMAWMQAGSAAPAVTVAVAAAPAAAMPCHGTPPADGVAVHHVCQLCDLCHAGVTVAPAAPSLALAPAAALPIAAAPGLAARVTPDELFRPPR